MTAHPMNGRGALLRGLGGVLITSALVSALACSVASHLLWNWTPSLPLGLYWLTRGAPESLAKMEALVAFAVPAGVRDLVRERRYLPPGALLVKLVVATAGDRVCTEGGGLAINGEELGAILTEDSAGRPLPHYEGCRLVSDGWLYVGSRHPKSFDSRTFGPIRVSDIQGGVTPLWTY
jgi:conjugative transfer signal peptidase TraF